MLTAFYNKATFNPNSGHFVKVSNKCIRYTGSQSDEGNGVNTILKIDEATEMSSDVTNNGSTTTNECDRNHKSWVSLVNCCRGNEGKDEFPWKSKEVHDVVSAGWHFFFSFFSFFFIIIGLNGESFRELVQPGRGADHHAVVCLLHHLVNGILELL